MANHRAYSYRMNLLAFEVASLKKRMKTLESIINKFSEPKPFMPSEFAMLPNHLRKSYLAVVNRGECDATTALTLTKRKRAAESKALNELVNMGWLGKRRIPQSHGGPKTFFFVLREAKEALTALA